MKSWDPFEWGFFLLFAFMFADCCHDKYLYDRCLQTKTIAECVGLK